MLKQDAEAAAKETTQPGDVGPAADETDMDDDDVDPDDDDRVYDDGDGTDGDGEMGRSDAGEDVARATEPVEEQKDAETEEKSKYL